jgi:hypothetical protein
MNRETLKQAIADAKTIKETAIANAKLALEEAFTPQLTAMFAEKLNEMEDEVKEEESMEETFNIDELLAELDGIDEYAEEQPNRDMDGDGDVDADDVKLMKEEDLMLEEMSDEEIEELVAQVIDDMIASGKLMAGEGEEEGEEEMDMDDMDMDMDNEEESEKEEIDIDETLAEILAEIEEEEVVSETSFVDPATLELVAKASEMLGVSKDAIMQMVAALPAAVIGGAFLKPAVVDLFKKIKAKVGGKKMEEASADTKEMEETINELRNELNEVNLLNAKLLYTNKIFKAKNLTESDKIKVLNAFDRAENVKGVKLVYETLTESLKTTSIVKKSQVKESLSSASRIIAPATPKQPIVEVNEAFARMQKIAGIKK